MPDAGPERVVVGRVGRPHGLDGALRVEATGPTLPAVAIGVTLCVRGPGPGGDRRLVLEERTGAPPRLTLRFVGIRRREDAQPLVGALIEVPADELPPLDDADTVYVRDLIGCRVRVGQRPLGAVVGVLSAPANDVLEVEGPDGRALVPFTADAVPHVDFAGRVVVVREGLLAD